MIVIKSKEEIGLMRESGKVTGHVLNALSDYIKPGLTTLDIDDFVREIITSHKMIPTFKDYGGFPGNACVSVNDVVVHGIPSDDVILVDGDIVSVDITVEKNGYNGDAARTFLIGNVSEEKRQLVKVTEECFFKALEGLRAGTPLYDIGCAVQTYAESFGYGVVRALTGHGIGRDMHEDPAVPNYGKRGTGLRLKAGMTICIEPMINMGTWKVWQDPKDGWTIRTLDGKPAAHYENTVLITEDGVEILTL